MARLTKEARIAVFMGGTSRERGISLQTGKAVVRALRTRGYNVTPIVLDHDNLSQLNSHKIDIAFLAMHGRFGEDGQLTRLLRERGIPCTGSTPEASALAMDKVRTKKVLQRHGIPTPPYIVLCGDFTTAEADWLARADIGYPCVLKPVADGSSFGISIVRDRDGLDKALATCLKSGPHALIERYIPGRELTCGILAGRALPLIEIKPKHKFYDFDAKYYDCGTEYILKPKLTRATYEKVSKLAVAVHNSLGAGALSRVDLILSEDKIPYVLEANLIPGMTSKSLVPKAARALGISFGRLCEMILDLALEADTAYNYFGEASGRQEEKNQQESRASVLEGACV